MHTTLAIALISLTATHANDDAASLVGTYEMNSRSYTEQLRAYFKSTPARFTGDERMRDDQLERGRDTRYSFTLDAAGGFTFTGSWTNPLEKSKRSSSNYDGRWALMGDHVVLIDTDVIPEGDDDPSPALSWAAVFDRADGGLVLNAGTPLYHALKGIRFDLDQHGSAADDVAVTSAAKSVKDSPLVGAWKLDTEAYAEKLQKIYTDAFNAARRNAQRIKEERRGKDDDHEETDHQRETAKRMREAVESMNEGMQQSYQRIARSTILLHLAADGTYALDASMPPAEDGGETETARFTGQWGIVDGDAICFGARSVSSVLLGGPSSEASDLTRCAFVLKPSNDPNGAALIAGTTPLLGAQPIVHFTRAPDEHAAD